MASGAVVVGGLAVPAASMTPDREAVSVLNFLLAFEELQAEFYVRTLREISLDGELLQFARTAAGHERAHAAFLGETLGTAAAPSPRFELPRAPDTAAAFARLAIVLEDVGVALYDGQAANLTPAAFAAAGQILSVEARHAAWIRDLAGEEPAPVPSDVPASAEQVVGRLSRVGVRVG